jgi:hypothetical protein
MDRPRKLKRSPVDASRPWPRLGSSLTPPNTLEAPSVNEFTLKREEERQG